MGRLTEKENKTRVLHDALGNHDWVYIHARYLRLFDTAISNDRRVCLGCKRIEYEYGFLGWKDAWLEDRSPLACHHIDDILEAFPEYIDRF